MNIPSLRVSTARGCNHRCAFCQVDGDFSSTEGTFEGDWLERVKGSVERFYLAGVRHFSITGGEPLADPYPTFEIANLVEQLIGPHGKRAEGYLRINTNGVHGLRHIEEIVSHFDLIKISLHGLDVSSYRKMTGSRSAERDFKSVCNFIHSLSELGANVRLQTVLTQENFGLFPKFISFCESQPCIKELKVFDVSEYQTLWHGRMVGSLFWEREFASIDPLIERAHEEWNFLGEVFSVGGYGNPMPLFALPSGLRVRFRSSSKGAFYSEHCQDCPAFSWCSDGHCNLEVGPNCIVKVCRPQEGKTFELGQESSAIDYFRSLKFYSDRLPALRVQQFSEREFECS
ncbi:MAG: radical SAM protein [Pseudomonadota bacterium]